MSRRITGLFAGAALAATAAAGAAAFAQPAPMAPPAGGMQMQHKELDPQERARKLSDVLQLRPNQQAAALAFVTAMAPTHRMGPPPGERPTATPEMLNRMEQRMAERQAAMRTKIEATRRFYAQLDANQKKAFDAIAPMMMRGHMGGGKRMKMHHDHGRMGGHMGPGKEGSPPAN